MEKAAYKKHNKGGRIVRSKNVLVDTAHGGIKRFRCSDLQPYFAHHDPTQTFHNATANG